MADIDADGWSDVIDIEYTEDQPAMDAYRCLSTMDRKTSWSARKTQNDDNRLVTHLEMATPLIDHPTEFDDRLESIQVGDANGDGRSDLWSNSEIS